MANLNISSKLYERCNAYEWNIKCCIQDNAICFGLFCRLALSFSREMNTKSVWKLQRIFLCNKYIHRTCVFPCSSLLSRFLLPLFYYRGNLFANQGKNSGEKILSVLQLWDVRGIYCRGKTHKKGSVADWILEFLFSLPVTVKRSFRLIKSNSLVDIRCVFGWKSAGGKIRGERKTFAVTVIY